MTAGGGDRNIEELKSLVLSTLETNGVLGQIRAQLRANVYKAIECDEDQVSAAASPGHTKLMKSKYARLIAEIVAEFFVFYDFKHSLSVFVPEASLGHERRSRNDVASDAGLSDVARDSSILEQLIAATTASKQMDRQQGEPQPRQQRQKQQQQKLQQKQQKQQQSASLAAPSPEPQQTSSVQPRISDGSSAPEEGSAKATASVLPEQQDPQVAQWGDTQNRRVARSEEFSVADSLGGPATTHDSFDEEFDRKMEEQIDSKIQRVNSCATGDVAMRPVAIAGSVGAGEPTSPQVVDAGLALADSTGEISLDGSASESGQVQDLRQGTSTQSQSSPRSSHHNSISEDASPAQYASHGSPLASQSVSPSVSNESLRSPAHSSLGSHSQGSLQQPSAEAMQRETASRSQESSLHSEQDLPLHGGGGGQGPVSGGSSSSSVANAHNHSRLGLDGAGRGSFVEDSDQEGDDSMTIEDEDEGDIDLTDLQSHGSDDQF